MKSYVIDSYAMIAYFEDEPGAELVSQILREIRDKKAKGFMCVINWGEIYYNVMREVGEGKAKKVLEKLNSYSIEIVDADKRLTLEAARLKAKYRIAYADCFTAALGKLKKAEVITGDPEFRKLSKEIRVKWI